MINKAIILIISAFFLSSCVTGPEGYFKKSANNKVFDRKGSKGGKRPPLYNKKYIAKAKQNVANNDYEEDEEDYDSLFENENISQANRDMYRRILEQEVESRYLGKGLREKKDKAYPVLVRNSTRPNSNYNDDNSELRAELDQIKAMLSETKNEMASYRCPTAGELEKAQAKLLATPLKNTTDNDEKYIKQKLEPAPLVKKNNSPNESVIINPVKSI